MAELLEKLKSLAEKINSLFAEKQWSECIHACTEFLDLAGKNASIPTATKAGVYHNRGVAYTEVGLYAFALADLDTALKLDADVVETYNARGSVHSEKGDVDLAISDYNKALGLNPNFAPAYNNRGSAYGKKGEFDRALADYNKALEIQPKNADLYTNRANAYNGKGELGRAIADYTKAIEIQPNFAAYNNRASAYARSGHLDSAISDYDEAIKIEPNNIVAIQARGILLFQKNSEKNQEERLKEIRESYKSFLKVEEYKSRQKKYRLRTANTRAAVKKKLGCLKICAFALMLVVVATVGAYLVGLQFEDIGWLQFNIFIVLPLITVAVGLCASPFIWEINSLKKDEVRWMALDQDAYTKGEMVTVISADIVPEAKKDLLLKFFDHHAQHGSAQLIIDLENNDKSDGGAENVIIQHLKDNLSGKN
ncbi:MAG: tetratricopeptide repeat protein [Gammaproteobacteria bacterium]|nr:tetratricopeptide repeat protein [Gammaproteobacteria bacterium]